MSLSIRHAEPEDYIGVCAIFAQPIAQKNTLQLPYPSQTMWKERLSKSTSHGYSWVAIKEQHIVGHAGLWLDASPRRRHVASIGMAVHDDWQGQKIGTSLLKTALDMADQWLNLHRIELEVYEDNHTAIELYKKYGFTIEGKHMNDTFRAGEYVNVLSMARLSQQSRP